MTDLLQKQILESCKLALPEGLKDLMSDISREVLRAQPRDIYKFIASYLQSLLQVRETLAVACRVCAETCECACEFDVYEELRIIGVNEEDVEKAVDIIERYFKKDTVKEQSLFLKLIRKINIEENQVGALKHIVQRAYNRYRRPNIDKINDESKESIAAHTLALYNENKIIGNITSPTRPNLKTVSSISLAGSYTCSQSSEHVVEPAALSKISEECGSLDYTKNITTKVLQDIIPGVKFSSPFDTKLQESLGSSSKTDVVYDNKQKVESQDIQQDIVISDDEELIVDEINEEDSSESSVIEESLLNSPRGSDG